MKIQGCQNNLQSCIYLSYKHDNLYLHSVLPRGQLSVCLQKIIMVHHSVFERSRVMQGQVQCKVTGFNSKSALLIINDLREFSKSKNRHSIFVCL